jgi:hypothetical protein
MDQEPFRFLQCDKPSFRAFGFKITRLHSNNFGTVCELPRGLWVSLNAMYDRLIFSQIASTIQKYIWGEVGKLDTDIVDVILDELVRSATDSGVGTPRCEAIANIISSLSSISVRGRIYSKLRKVSSAGSRPKCCCKPVYDLGSKQNIPNNFEFSD